MKENWTRICPRCKSREVTERGIVYGRSYSNDYVCLSCGWQSPFFPEIRKKYAEELPEQKIQFTKTGFAIIADKTENSDDIDKKSQNKTSIKVALILFLIIVFVIVMIIVGGRFLT